MKHTALATLLVILPVSTFALDFQHGNDRYTDASRLTVAERAAVSVLTDIGAVSGNPDGSFAPERTLNRAEFTKIALLSFPPSGPKDAEAPTCFPDVQNGQWFHPYVCEAKDAGIVEGNPDGLFHPARSVNYAEATKILVKLAGYDLPKPPANERWTWYRAYVLAAEERGVSLPGNIDAATELTRGEMARLAAAFVAERGGALVEYRDAERGVFHEDSSSSSSSFSASSEASSSDASSSDSSSSSSVSSSTALYPAQDSFLLTGARTPLILSGEVPSIDEPSYIRRVEYALRREVPSIGRVYMVDGNGEVIVELIPSTNNNNDRRKWEASMPDGTFLFSSNAPTKVGIVFDVKVKDFGGGSNQLVETESFQIQSEGQTSLKTKYLFPSMQVYPIHQTSFGRITGVEALLPPSGTIAPGQQRKIASLHIDAESVDGASVNLEGFDAIINAADVSVSNVRIGDVASNRLAGCGVEKLDTTMFVNCGKLPRQLFLIPEGGMTVSLYADVSLLGPATGTLNVSLKGRGALGANGSLVWSDGAATFNWIEQRTPFDGGGIAWTVSQ